MKYRHRYHAGNFADVHKHVTLLALLAALQKKDKGFLYLDTHAGRGAYDLSSPSAEARAGIGRFRKPPSPPRNCAPTRAALAQLRAHLQATPLLRWLAAPGRAGAARAGPRGADRAAGHRGTPAARERRRTGQRRAAPTRAWSAAMACSGSRRICRRRSGADSPSSTRRTRRRRRISLRSPRHLRRRCGASRPAVAMAWYPIKEQRQTRAWHAVVARTLDRPAAGE